MARDQHRARRRATGDGPFRRSLGIAMTLADTSVPCVDVLGLGMVSARNPVLRYAGNPIVTAADVNRVWQDPSLNVVTVHNAGADIVGGETALILRYHQRCGRSVLGMVCGSAGGT